MKLIDFERSLITLELNENGDENLTFGIDNIIKRFEDIEKNLWGSEEWYQRMEVLFKLSMAHDFKCIICINLY